MDPEQARVLKALIAAGRGSLNPPTAFGSPEQGLAWALTNYQPYKSRLTDDADSPPNDASGDGGSDPGPAASWQAGRAFGGTSGSLWPWSNSLEGTDQANDAQSPPRPGSIPDFSGPAASSPQRLAPTRLGDGVPTRSPPAAEPNQSTTAAATSLQPARSLPANAYKYLLAWSNGTGSFQWNSAQIAIDGHGAQSPTGVSGGLDVIMTTNPNGIASTDVANTQTRQIDRTYYDATTGEPLGTFPVVPGQTVKLNDGQTQITFGLPSPPSRQGQTEDGFQIGGGVNSLEDLRAQQAQFAQETDPYEMLDRWAHAIQIPRTVDYLTPSASFDPISADLQIDALNAFVPEARGTRPATADDLINAAIELTAPVTEFAGAAGTAEPTLEGLEAVLGRVPGPRFVGYEPAPGLPLSRAELRGVRRFNPKLPAHAIAADAEERLANVVQSLPDEQVVRWGDPIGSHGADVISVNKRTGEVTLWDAKYRGTDTRIQHSTTFKANTRPWTDALEQAEDTLTDDKILPDAIRQKALDNLRAGRLKTRTVGYGRARNSTFQVDDAGVRPAEEARTARRQLRL